MHLVSDVCIESGLDNEDLRLILSDTRLDWADCEKISDAERELILNSSRAKLTGTTDITPVNPNEMPVETQQKIVQSASQVLNARLVLAIAEEIQIFDAIDQVKNQIIINNRENRKRELAQALGNDWRNAKSEYLDSLRSLSNHVIPQIEIEPDSIDAKAEIAKIHQEMGKQLIK